MRKSFILLCISLILLVALPTLAQEPGEGGPVIEGNSTGSINIGPLNPLRCQGVDCAQVNGLLFPTLLGVDPETGGYAPNMPDSLVTGWEISDDGTVYTFTLRDDLTWTDGTPLTANDYKFAMDAVIDGNIESPDTGRVGDAITDVTVVDDYTVQVTFGSAACDALDRAQLDIIPAHVFESFTDMVDNDFDDTPSVSSGVFSFLEKIPGERITLAANQEYAWAENGVIPQGYIYADVPDANVLLERLLAGELNYSEDHPATSFQTVRETDTLRTVEFPSLSWSYIGLNLADPENPANAFDENGDPIDQGHHPLFGDVRVRRAFQNAINVEEIIDAALDGEGSVMASYDVPTSWALDPDLAPVPYDPDAARALLDEAGFTDEDGDGVRECNGCEFAEEGTPLSFELFSDDDDTSSRIGVLVQERLAEVGMEVDFAQYDFNTAIDNIVSQTFDAYILGWSGGYPADPDWSNQFTPAGDELEFGFADTSYNNPEVTQLFEEARNVPGCALEDRAEIYHEIQRILQEDQPYIWLYASNEQYAISTEFENAEVLPFQPFYNVQDWSRSG